MLLLPSCHDGLGTKSRKNDPEGLSLADSFIFIRQTEIVTPEPDMNSHSHIMPLMQSVESHTLNIAIRI